MTRGAHIFLIVLLATAPALAQEPAFPQPPPSIVIEGQASVSVVPNAATISLGVVTERPHASDAVTENSKAVATVVQAIRAEGIEAKDIATTAFGLSPLLDQPKTGQPKIIAYEARNDLQFKVPLTDALGSLIAKLIDKGVNTIDGLSLTNDDEQVLRDRLKREAMRNARQQAELYASALGLRLGRVLGIKPGRDSGFQVQGSVRSMHGVPVPLETGQRTLTEQASVTFELVQ